VAFGGQSLASVLEFPIQGGKVRVTGAGWQPLSFRRQFAEVPGVYLVIVATAVVVACLALGLGSARERMRTTVCGMESDKEPLEGAVIVVEDSTIRYAGTDDARAQGAERLDAKGTVVTAGLVDVLTQIGTHEVSLEHTTRDDSDDPDEPDPIRAAFATADGYNPASSLVAVTRREGVTSVGVVPVGGLVAGQSAWADLDGTTPDQALARRSLALHVYLEDWQYGGFGKSRGAAMLRLRELFDDAKSYRANRGAYEKSMLRAHGVSRLDLEVIVRALDKKLPVVFHVDRASDILNVLAFAKAQGVSTVLASAVSFARYLPDLYRSTALLLIERPVAESFVRTSVSGELESRLHVIKQENLSRDRLTALINRFNLYPDMRQRASMEEVLNRMRLDIEVLPGGAEQVTGRTRTVSVSLSYAF
jgi:hypothetical protein